MMIFIYNASMKTALPSVFSFNESQWLDWLKANSYSPNTLDYVLDYIYKSKLTANLPENFKDVILNHFQYEFPQIAEVNISDDTTAKFLIEFKDGMQVESVLIPFNKRPTICLSTQVGCAMNCSFCYTGTQGLKRNLTADEVITQYLVVYDWMKKNQNKNLKPNIVFMGQGEPMHNWNEVSKAIDIFTHPKMVGLGPRQITLSTSGYLPTINPQELPSINYALSLHSPFEEQRSVLIPINQKYPLKEVITKLDQINLRPRQFITYEYLLIKDFNMSDDHVEGLTRLLATRKAILNLIPFNPFPGSRFLRPTEQEIDEFKEKLVAKKLRVMIRTTKGDDILAACGQLKVNKLARKSYV